MSAPRHDRWIDPACWACAVAYGVAAWWPTRDLPYHWDGATFSVDGARDLLATGFWPLLAGHSYYAHPPLFVATLALTWRIFGSSRLVSHALVLPALPAAMIGTYQLGKRVAGRPVGAVAALLFAGVPVVLEEVGQIYMDLPIAALATWALVAWLAGRRCLAGGLLTAAALIEIPAPLIIPAALLAVTAATPTRRRDLRASMPLLLPFLADAAWVAYHREVTGWALWRPGHVVSAPQGLVAQLRALGVVFDWLLLEQGRWILAAAALGGLAWVCAWRGRRHGVPHASLVPLLAPVALGLLFFAGVGEFGLRYGILLLPPYFVACLTLFRLAFPERSAGRWTAAFGAGLFALFQTHWHPTRPLTSTYAIRPDDDLAYLDMIAVGEQTSAWLEGRHADAEIYGAGPESYELAEPWQGYVHSPLSFSWCQAFARHADRTQLVIVHPYHAQQALCRAIVEETGARPVKLFQRGEKWMQVYRVPLPERTPNPPPARAP